MTEIHQRCEVHSLPAFAFGVVITSFTGIGSVHKMKMAHGIILPSPSTDVILMLSVLNIVHALSCWFVGFHMHRRSCMGFLPARARRKLSLVGSSSPSNNYFPRLFRRFEQRCRFYRRQILSRILHGLFEFHVFHIDIINFDNFRAFTSIGFFCSMLFSFCSVFLTFLTNFVAISSPTWTSF